MRGWIKFEPDGFVVHAEVDDGNRKFHAEGKIKRHGNYQMDPKLASSELDNLVIGLDKIIERGFFGEKI